MFHSQDIMKRRLLFAYPFAPYRVPKDFPQVKHKKQNIYLNYDCKEMVHLPTSLH